VFNQGKCLFKLERNLHCSGSLVTWSGSMQLLCVGPH